MNDATTPPLPAPANTPGGTPDVIAAIPEAPSILWLWIMPIFLVLLWSTGFPAAKLGLPHAEPFTFLMWRYAITAVIFLVLAGALKARWPTRRQDIARTAVGGVVLLVGHMGGVFWAIDAGVNSGVVAIIIGAHPVLTAIVAGPYLGERVAARQWLGFALGVAGTILVVSDKVALAIGGFSGAAGCAVALFAISFNMLLQKRHGAAGDLMASNANHTTAAAAVAGVLALSLETMAVDWVPQFLIAIGWNVLALSVGALTLLYVMIRKGAASRLAAFFFLVAPAAALEGYVMFDERLTAAAFIGMAVTAAGVFLVTAQGKRA